MHAEWVLKIGFPMVSLFACMNVGVEFLHAFSSSCECLSFSAVRHPKSDSKCWWSVVYSMYLDTFNVVAQSISPVLEFFNCPLHFEPPYCEMWNPTADKCYRLSVDEMHHSAISPHTIVYWRTYHPAMNWRYHPLTAFLKVNMWIDVALLGSMAANCLSFPESIVSDYSLLDHWNVLCRLPEFLTAVSFITANATVMAKHWFCCFHYLLFCPLLCLSKSHSVLMPLLCSSIVFPCCVGVIFSFRFTSASFI